MSARLMIPGPVPLEQSVAEAFAQPARAHYGPEWLQIYHEMIDGLHHVFRTQDDVFCLVSSGSGGLDAALGSLVSPGDRVLVGVNGFFGERLVAIARAYAAEVLEIRAELGEPLQPQAFEKALKQMSDAIVIAVAYVETSTGVLNPVRQIAGIARQYGVPILVDAVSALGGVEFEMDAWGVDLCVTASQKCLGAPPGLAPVAVSPRAWDVIDRRKITGRSWYLDLKTWRDYGREWADWHPYPVTVPTQTMLALRAGLKSILEEGLSRRIAKYRRLSQRLRSGLEDLGLMPLVADEWASPVLTAVSAPQGISPMEVSSFLEKEYDIKISGGLGRLAGKIFRIGHMGPTVSESDIDYVLEGLHDFLKRRG